MSDFLQDYFDTLSRWEKVKYRLAPFGDIQFALDASKWLTKQTPKPDYAELANENTRKLIASLKPCEGE